MSWLTYGEERDNRSWYDTQQVCLNGHQITAYGDSQRDSRRDNCEACGTTTIDSCPSCNKKIRGYKHVPGVFSIPAKVPPPYCSDCGQPYPWQRAAIDNVVQVFREVGLPDADAEQLRAALPSLATDTPATDSAALRVRRLLSSIEDPIEADVARRAVGRIACDSAAKVIGIDRTPPEPLPARRRR